MQLWFQMHCGLHFHSSIKEALYHVTALLSLNSLCDYIGKVKEVNLVNAIYFEKHDEER